MNSTSNASLTVEPEIEHLENATTIPGYPMNPTSWNELYIYAIYVVQGAVMLFGNMCLVLAICYHKALRSNKGYYVFAFMFLSDALNGFGQLFASIYRSYLIFAGTHDILVSRWECMLKLHTFVWAFAEPTAAMMLGVISLDRLFLIMAPGRYMNTMALTYFTIATPFVWNGCAVALAYIFSYSTPRVPSVPQYCLLANGLGKTYWAYHGFLSVLGSGISIGIYVVAMIMYRKKNRVGAGPGEVQSKAALKNQEKLTKNLGFSCVVTFFVFLIPRLIGTVLVYSSGSLGIDPKTTSSLMKIFHLIIPNLNAMINLVIFIRVDTIRTGVLAFLKCKSLPLNLNQWH